ncbi:unnamed protein product [Cunninghamella blakesleeana]
MTDINFPSNVIWNGPTVTLRTPILEDALEIKEILSDISTMKYLRFMTKEPFGWSLDDQRLLGKNIATEVYYLCLKFAFEQLHLHKVQWVTTKENNGMRGWLENVCNLPIEAIIKDDIIVNNEFISSYIYAMFEYDWEGIKTKLEKRIN